MSCSSFRFLLRWTSTTTTASSAGDSADCMARSRNAGEAGPGPSRPSPARSPPPSSTWRTRCCVGPAPRGLAEVALLAYWPDDRNASDSAARRWRAFVQSVPVERRRLPDSPSPRSTRSQVTENGCGHFASTPSPAPAGAKASTRDATRINRRSSPSRTPAQPVPFDSTVADVHRAPQRKTPSSSIDRRARTRPTRTNTILDANATTESMRVPEFMRSFLVCRTSHTCDRAPGSAVTPAETCSRGSCAGVAVRHSDPRMSSTDQSTTQRREPTRWRRWSASFAYWLRQYPVSRDLRLELADPSSECARPGA